MPAIHTHWGVEFGGEVKKAADKGMVKEEVGGGYIGGGNEQHCWGQRTVRGWSVKKKEGKKRDVPVSNEYVNTIAR